MIYEFTNIKKIEFSSQEVYKQYSLTDISESFSLSLMWNILRGLLLSLTGCYYHVIHTFQSESTFYSCLNLKELLAQNICDISSLSGSNTGFTSTFQSWIVKNTEKTLLDLVSRKLPQWLGLRDRIYWNFCML